MDQDQVMADNEPSQKKGFTSFSLFTVAMASLLGGAAVVYYLSIQLSSDERPIVITGNSVGVEFDHDKYKAVSGGAGANQLFRHKRLEVTDMRIFLLPSNEEGNPPTEGNKLLCSESFGYGPAAETITIKYNKGGEKLLEVRSADGTVEIEFDQSANGLEPLSPNSNAHYSGSADILGISSDPRKQCFEEIPDIANKNLRIEIDASRPR